MPRSSIDARFAHFCRTGDAAALAEVFDATARELLHVALWLSGNRSDAEDLLQRTFMLAIVTRGKFEPGRPAVPWLLGLLSREVRRLRRERGRRPPPTSMAAAPDPEAAAATAELTAAVRSVRAQLREPYRDVLQLHLEQGLNAREIAARLGRPAGTVRTQLMRALELLRRGLPRGFAMGMAPLLPSGAQLAAIRSEVLMAAAATSTTVVTVTAGALMTKKLTVALLAIAIGLGGYLAMPRAAAGPHCEAAPPPIPAAASTAPIGPASVERVAVNGARLQVVDAATGQPIPTARLLAVQAGSRGFDPQRAATLASADALGAIACALPFDPIDKVVFAEGHAAAVAPPLVDEVAVLRLQRGRSLTVRAVDEGDMPVAATEVLLMLAGAGDSERLPVATRVGNPAHGQPLWSASTDDHGIAVFAGLPDAALCLVAWHDTLSPLSRIGVGEQPVQPGGEIEVRMGALYGVSAALPASPALVHVGWQIPWGILDRTLPMQMRMAAASQSLAQRFPGTCVFAGRPSAMARSVTLHCQAIGDDGSVFGVDAKLVPLAEVQPAPLLLLPDQRSALVQIDVFDADGTALPMPLDLFDPQSRSRSTLHVDAGTAAWLPYGSYRIRLPIGGWFEQVPETSLSLRVGDGEPFGGHFPIRLPMRLARLVLDAGDEGRRDGLTCIHIGLRGGGHACALMNLDVRQGPWTAWVPYAKVEVKMQSARYADWTQAVEIDRPEVRLALQLQPRNPDARRTESPEPDRAIPDRHR